jgi:Flp pilus assembly pilin Flp
MPLDFIMTYGGYILGFLAVGLLAYWTFDERDQTENIAETVERVGERAETVTGGLFGGLGSLIVVLVSIFVTIGNELVMSFTQLVPMLQSAPAVVGQVLLGLLALGNLEGYVPMKPWQFGAIFIAVLLATGIAKFGLGYGGGRGASP